MPTEMIHSAGAPADASPPLPDLILYGRLGCHLCDETRELLLALIDERRQAGGRAPNLVERDVTANPDWERAFSATVPVVELDGVRLELATSARRLRRLLDHVLGATPRA